MEAAAQVVVPCVDLASTLAFFTDRLGMRVELISPADDPALVVISGLGVRLRLVRVAPGEMTAPPEIVIAADHPVELLGAADALIAPNGSRITVIPARPPLVIPAVEQSLVIDRLADAGGWHAGRAGMGYRDLVPDRQGGRFVASHIRIAAGGTVPDYVHFHDVRFQMIFCYRGWVEVVYEDQGEPFVMHPGDCVLQPPMIRHRVLESSAGLEVIEIGCPAIHDTHADPATTLPTGRVLPERGYGLGQRFVRHIAADATWSAADAGGFEFRNIGIDGATHGVAGVRVLRRALGDTAIAAEMTSHVHTGEFFLTFVLDGTVTAHFGELPPTALAHGDCVVVPAGTEFAWTCPSADLELLEVTLPAGIGI